MEQLFGDCACVCLDDEVRAQAVAYYNEPESNAVCQAAATTIEASICGHWSRVRELAFLAALKRYRAVEQLRQDLCDQVALESMGGCGSQLVSVQGVRGASEEQLLNMARKEGPLPSRYGLE